MIFDGRFCRLMTNPRSGSLCLLTCSNLYQSGSSTSELTTPPELRGDEVPELLDLPPLQSIVVFTDALLPLETDVGPLVLTSRIDLGTIFGRPPSVNFIRSKQSGFHWTFDLVRSEVQNLEAIGHCYPDSEKVEWFLRCHSKLSRHDH